MGSEKNFENKIKDYLKAKGYYYVKFFANSYTKVGVPDILACINGHFVAIEVKAETGRPSELQKINRSLIRTSGGISIILYPDKWEEFKVMVDDLAEGRDYLDLYSEQYNFDKK